MADSMQAVAIRSVIASLTDAAMCGDWQGSDAASVLRVMGRNPLQARDVPVAMEMVALLQHFATRLDVRDVPGLGVEGQEDVELTPGIVWGGSKLLVLLDVPAGAFDDIAYWVADSLPSAKIKAMPGVLALPFTIESTGEGDEAQAVLFPDWVAVFYPHARAEHAFPILALRSVLSNDAFGGDWVDAAIGRMGFYGLPRKLAEQFVAKGTAPL
ncbi:hypothetical protein [Verminephrobacter eiseniae]|uniref:hypothetical protein n=1 Tax=Verminephrobacter eiseniae TaxID=364317 RepID=UPI0010DC47CA|nr:hypothetical protein [Verminephrobacter eiseniae]KAB7619715.1 hypothetical protein ET532_006065 [Verminephrobacter sp. Larva24]MCW5230813.1 hypothetical protein [Verminephrobacter eiseniae]MCW5292546.1 hypothetical protein [Verminephrobacter eiseniae]MCW8187103.1 hypothetical protein [Verminephrobacter eiseniae]MCW8223520.1 hypothetical protein [Verminephrobacter eiseniae]